MATTVVASNVPSGGDGAKAPAPAHAATLPQGVCVLFLGLNSLSHAAKMMVYAHVRQINRNEIVSAPAGVSLR